MLQRCYKDETKETGRLTTEVAFDRVPKSMLFCSATWLTFLNFC
jgi:hypothetical protein